MHDSTKVSGLTLGAIGNKSKKRKFQTATIAEAGLFDSNQKLKG
jgi:hypothetical protein